VICYHNSVPHSVSLIFMGGLRAVTAFPAGARKHKWAATRGQPTLQRLSRDTLHMRAHQELSRALITGVFLPGQPVTLRQLVKSLGTSIMPVRDAVGRLIAAGALQMLPNRSVIVPQMTRSRFIELSRVRQAIEGMAAEKACQIMDSDTINQIRKVNELAKRAIAKRRYDDAFLSNRDFHFAIYNASRMQVAPPLIDTLWLQAAPFLCLSLVEHGAIWSAAHHDAAIEAFEARDSTAARRAIERDIEETLVNLLEHGAFTE